MARHTGPRFAGKGDVIIERNGKDIIVVIPAEDYEQIRETLEDMRAVREAASNYEEWKNNPSVARPWDEVDNELGNKAV
jgi:PHD/YefM family antitoxin component YafN of YafNO toxin-antitoxin module